MEAVRALGDAVSTNLTCSCTTEHRPSHGRPDGVLPAQAAAARRLTAAPSLTRTAGEHAYTTGAVVHEHALPKP
jgi:hypothetical protein